MDKQAQPKNSNKSTKADYIWATGRRKRAIARIRLYQKDTKDTAIEIMVNDKPIGQYFFNPVAKLTYGQPLKLTDTVGKYRVTAKVSGSGQEAQLDAIKHGIARALVKADEAHKATLKAHGLLTRDSREKQKRMIGRGGRARAKKQSPKR